MTPSACRKRSPTSSSSSVRTISLNWSVDNILVVRSATKPTDRDAHCLWSPPNAHAWQVRPCTLQSRHARTNSPIAEGVRLLPSRRCVSIPSKQPQIVQRIFLTKISSHQPRLNPSNVEPVVVANLVPNGKGTLTFVRSSFTKRRLSCIAQNLNPTLGFDGVVDQIRHYLLELHAISRDS